ncbi:MAG TPA: DUF4199 domain-containing protein [Flavitalea sp.]|nr:DUF4199 domain-containing protein [Flavitalea sp.]
MKKNALIFGLIAGSILTFWMVYTTSLCYNNPKFESNDAIGYAGMLVTFSLIFVAIKNYRDKHNGGIITFGKGFKLGFYVSLIAATMYVGAWLIDYYIFMPDFLDSYSTHVLYQASLDGATQPELDEKAAEMADFKELYKNPLFVVLISYSEVLPVGIVISLISALILKRK